MVVKWRWRPPRPATTSGGSKRKCERSLTIKMMLLGIIMLLMILLQLTTDFKRLLMVEGARLETVSSIKLDDIKTSQHRGPEATRGKTMPTAAAGKQQQSEVGIGSESSQRPDMKLAESAGHDPMEACYLANNRASESLTISESTPIGSVVGELMVNGDSSANGNIDLSIRMPTNFHINNQDLISSSNHGSGFSKRRFSSTPLSNNNDLNNHITSPHDLNNLIDSMPPLTIERDSKRLILSKKLDRESLDKYWSGYQLSSASSNNHLPSSSASLTVHVKCQLRVQSNQADIQKRSNFSLKDFPITNPAGADSASDQANSIVIPIHLIVTDDNDNWPTFINSPYVIDLNESSQSGSLLTGNEIVAIDNDQQGPLSTIEYSILNGNLYSDSFVFLNPLDSRSLVVKDSNYLDYESQSKLNLRVLAKDQGEPANWAVATLYVNILDIDDTNPVFGEDKYFGFIKTNKPGEQIDLGPRRLVARDGDKSINAPISYSFHVKTNQSIHFELDRDLAKLTIKKSLPEDQETFYLLIRATQIDNPLRYSVTMVTIQPTFLSNPLMTSTVASSNRAGFSSSTTSNPLTNNHDLNGPRFSHLNFTVEVSEMAPIGFSILNLNSLLSTTDPEKQSYFFYLLDDDQESFQLDLKTSLLTLNKSLDYEMYRQLSVRVMVSNEPIPNLRPQQDIATTLLKRNGNIGSISPVSPVNSALYLSFSCDIIRININILDSNEYAPEFSHDLYNFQLSISDLVASLEGNATTESLVDDTLGYRALFIGQIYCSDRDYNDKVTLQMSGNRAILFHLTQDGRLYLPLVNTSSHASASQYSIPRSSSVTENPSWLSGSWFGAGSRANPQQMVQRRQDFSSNENIDHGYVNHLLSQLSNHGRLRLKIQATDDGRPSSLQSTSLIVISIVSIDNFIIQQQMQNQQQESNELHPPSVVNMKSNPMVEYDQASSSQVMMIQSKNGRSFVQVHSDLLTNLMSSRTESINQTEKTGNTSVTFDQTRNGDDPYRDDSIMKSKSRSSLADSNKLNSDDSGKKLTNDAGYNVVMHKMQPSILLVGDDGPKFLYLPSAVEKAVNQHVQLERESIQDKKLRPANSSDNDGLIKKPQDSNSSWLSWIISPNNGHQNDNQSPMAWVLVGIMNISILVALILIVVKLRHYVLRRSHRNSRSNYLPQMINSFGSDNCHNVGFFSGLISTLKSSTKENGSGREDDQRGLDSQINVNTSFKNNYPIGNSSHINSDSSDLGSNFAFLTSDQRSSKHKDSQNLYLANQGRRHLTPSDISYSSSSSSCEGSKTSPPAKGTNKQQKIINGVIVNNIVPPKTAINHKLRDNDSSDEGPSMGHLKLTLNKILDQHPKSPVAKHLPVADKKIEIDESSRVTTSSQIDEIQQAKSSTFVGQAKAKNSISIVEVSSSSSSSTSSNGNCNDLNNKPLSASSISTSSSLSNISNNIAQAIKAESGKCEMSKTESFGFDSSDGSSLDSNTLFNRSTHQSAARKLDQAQLHSPHRPLPSTPVPSSKSVIPQTQTAIAPSSPRIPPQNPIHAKLRKQESSNGLICISSSNNQAALAQGSLKSKIQSRQDLISSSRPVAPPTPPLPCTKDDNKSVSPTTSVDKGYESYQSSSNKPNGIRSNVYEQPKTIPKRSLTGDLHRNHIPPPPPPPPSNASMSLARSIKRQIKPSNSRLLSTNELPETQSPRDKDKLNRDAIIGASNAPVNRTKRHIDSVKDKSPQNEAKVSRMSNDSASEAHKQEVVIGGTRFRSSSLRANIVNEVQMNHQISDSSRQTERKPGRRKQKNSTESYECETEDDDFHYGRISGSAVAANAKKPKDVTDMLLANYASHQYVNASPDQDLNELERHLKLMTKVAAQEEHRQHAALVASRKNPDVNFEESYFEPNPITSALHQVDNSHPERSNKQELLGTSRMAHHYHPNQHDHPNHHHHHHHHHHQNHHHGATNSRKTRNGQSVVGNRPQVQAPSAASILNKKTLTWSDQLSEQ